MYNIYIEREKERDVYIICLIIGIEMLQWKTCRGPKLPQHTTTCRSDVELHWRVENEACSDTDKIVIDQQIEVLTSDEECQISFSMLQYIIYIDK